MLKFFCSSKKRESKFSSVLFCRWNEGIAAGQSRPKSAPAFRPRYCFLDKKVLRFFAYFQEVAGLDDRAPEKRIRHVHILYHLEDDSISILEPRTNVIISSFITYVSMHISIYLHKGKKSGKMSHYKFFDFHFRIPDYSKECC